MENENKDFQGTSEESEMQEKVREDVSSKIAEAAAQLQDEIAEAEAEAAVQEDAAIEDEAAEDVDSEKDDDAEETDGDAELDTDEIYAEPVKEPKRVSIKVSSLVLSLIGTAIAGALILLLGFQISDWVENMPEGKKAVSVDGVSITDLDMKYYIYMAANDYYQDNNNDNSVTVAGYDWSQTNEDGKTAEEIVKENALDMAVGEVLIMNIGDKNNVEWDEKSAEANAKSQTDQLINMYGEELIILNSKAQGLSSIKQYNRKIVQYDHLQTVETDLEENSSKYYPEDTSVLNDYITDGKASVKHILISNDEETTEAVEGEDAEPVEDNRAKAEEILNRIRNGEDFDALMNEFNEDTAETEAGYTFTAGEMTAAFERAAFALKIDEVSDIVESEYGYHIIKRIPGRYELEGYLKSQAKIKTFSAFEKLSVADILSEIETATADFQTKYAELQQSSK